MSLRLIDTTLRDGAQRTGMRWNFAQRLWFASRLAGQPWVSELEAGIPVASDEEATLVGELSRMKLPCIITAWSRMHEQDVRRCMETGVDRIHITVPASRLHLEKKLDIGLTEAVDRLTRLVELARGGGHLVSVGLEDASRADMQDLIIWVSAGLAAGVDRFRLADTIGRWCPSQIAACVRSLLEQIGPVNLAVHTHDDLGMACANAYAAFEAGAGWADVTICGIGERAGNCDARDLTALLGMRTEGLRQLEQALSLFNPECVDRNELPEYWHFACL